VFLSVSPEIVVRFSRGFSVFSTQNDRQEEVKCQSSADAAICHFGASVYVVGHFKCQTTSRPR